ncbi:MAG: rhomboid family intramembrane serine protease [Deltaproteobacteria bacterium]
MVIIPLTGRMSWRNPPVMTLVFIFINCFVYFSFQLHDSQKYHAAISWYLHSELVEIESARYLQYLRNTGKSEDADRLAKLDVRKPEARAALFIAVWGDSAFNRKLDNGEIITPADSQYSQWRPAREAFLEKMAAVVFWKYGFIPTERKPVSFLTHMFLHGSVMHLVGNMVFLWLVGCLVEMGTGRLILPLCYVLTGLFAVTFFALIYRNSSVPLVGASGAIAGLMGCYTVLYGTRKVDIFYSLGFYFNKAKIPAMILLPVWVGNEAFQLSFGGESNVAYVAHIGGLLAGSFFGLVTLRFLGGLHEDIFAEKPEDRLANLIEKGLQSLAKLDLQSARLQLEEALALDPDNKQVIIHLFNVEKLAPKSEHFHRAAIRAMNRLHRETALHSELFGVYSEYKRLVGSPRLTPDLYAQLGINFAHNGQLDEAARILTLLLKKSPGTSLVPTGLFTLARAYLKNSMTEKGRKCLNILCKRYPDSPEGRTALRMLQQA